MSEKKNFKLTEVGSLSLTSDTFYVSNGTNKDTSYVISFSNEAKVLTIKEDKSGLIIELNSDSNVISISNHDSMIQIQTDTIAQLTKSSITKADEKTEKIKNTNSIEANKLEENAKVKESTINNIKIKDCSSLEADITNSRITGDITIRGNVRIEGNLVVSGTIKSEEGKVLFGQTGANISDSGGIKLGPGGTDFPHMVNYEQLDGFLTILSTIIDGIVPGVGTTAYTPFKITMKSKHGG